MRRTWVLVVLAVTGAFLAGRAVAPTQASATATAHVYTGRIGDTFRAPAAAARCVVSAEAGAAKVSCEHTPRARYSVVFFRSNLLVYRNGDPDRPVFSAQGRP
jgi:hypothetical protein